jgi:hypothetical protein
MYCSAVNLTKVFRLVPTLAGADRLGRGCVAGAVAPAAFRPKVFRNLKRIDPHVVPPRRFVPAGVQFTVVVAAKRDGELITDLAAHRPRLGEPDVMGVARRRAAENARLGRDKFQVLLVADAARFGEGEGAFVDRTGVLPLMLPPVLPMLAWC